MRIWQQFDMQVKADIWITTIYSEEFKYISTFSICYVEEERNLMVWSTSDSNIKAVDVEIPERIRMNTMIFKPIYRELTYEKIRFVWTNYIFGCIYPKWLL